MKQNIKQRAFLSHPCQTCPLFSVCPRQKNPTLFKTHPCSLLANAPDDFYFQQKQLPSSLLLCAQELAHGNDLATMN
jgi:hypothetical protein